MQLVLHHVHGGLHNAAMALQLAAEGEGTIRDAGGDARLVSQSGLEGIAQAARGVSLLTVLLGLSAGPSNAPADRQWVELVVSLLRQRAADRGVDATIEPALVPPGGAAPDADRLARMFLEGIDAIDRAEAGTHVNLPRTETIAA